MGSGLFGVKPLSEQMIAQFHVTWPQRVNQRTYQQAKWKCTISSVTLFVFAITIYGLFNPDPSTAER